MVGWHDQDEGNRSASKFKLNTSSYDQMFRNGLFNTMSKTDVLLKLQGALEVFCEQRPGKCSNKDSEFV